jgi:hypothetical protein
MFRKTRPRRGEQPTLLKRDPAAKARALAFEDIYRNYANPLVNHHLTPEDLEDVRQSVRPKMIAYMDYYQDAEYGWLFWIEPFKQAWSRPQPLFYPSSPDE